MTEKICTSGHVFTLEVCDRCGCTEPIVETEVAEPDNKNFFWDDTNDRLGINTDTPYNNSSIHAEDLKVTTEEQTPFQEPQDETSDVVLSEELESGSLESNEPSGFQG